MAVEEKWKANQKKVSFMKQFPGLLTSWENANGKTIQAVKPLPSKPHTAVLVFSDGCFTIAPPPAPEPWDLGQGLQAARAELAPTHPEAFAEYDRLVQQDQRALRNARAEKIIGAIQNNLEKIPELKDQIRQLVLEWEPRPPA